MGVGFDRGAGLAHAGGYSGHGVVASSLAGRTLADLITGTESELTGLPWVGHVSRRWEPEPLRFLAARTIAAVAASADEARSARAARRDGSGSCDGGCRGGRAGDRLEPTTTPGGYFDRRWR